MGTMARRPNRRTTPRRQAHTRPLNLGGHWRADGAPKNAYLSRDEALMVADERRRATGADLEVYRCDVCDAWHMGGSRGREG